MSTTSKSSSKFVRGAFQLLGSTILIKLIGVFFIIPLQRIVELRGVGIYNQAYPIYAVALQISAVGIPLALSKLIAERLSQKDQAGAFALYASGARILSVTGFIAFAVVLVLSPIIARLLGNPDATLSIMVLSTALLVVTRLSAMRGLLQGHQYMGHSSTSQVWEQAVRVVTIIIGAWIVFHFTYGYLHWSVEDATKWAVAAATGGALTGAIAAWISLRWSIRKVGLEAALHQKGSKRLAMLIIQTSVPLSMASLVLPLSQAVDSFTISNLLQFGGYSYDKATEYFAVFSQATRMMNLPLSFATAIGLPSVPAIARAMAERDQKTVHEQVNLVLRFTTILTMPACVVFIVLARPIAVLLDKTSLEYMVFAEMSLMAVLAAIEMTTTYVLQAIGKLTRPVRNMLIGLLVKLVLNLALVTTLGLTGAAIGTVVGYAASSLLNLLAVQKYTGAELEMGLIFTRPLLACIPMGLIMYGVHSAFQWTTVHVILKTAIGHKLAAVLTIADLGIVCLAGGYAYLIIARIVGVLTQTEIQRLSVINRLLPPVLRVQLPKPSNSTV